MKFVSAVVALALLTPCRAQAIEASIKRSIEELVAAHDHKDAPGGAICVVRDGKIVLLEAFGMADLEGGVPLTIDTSVYIASTAKAITGYCVAHAELAKKLDLNTSVRSVFPSLPASYATATLRQALHHTSGIPDIYDATVVADMTLEHVSTNERAIAFLGKLPVLNFAPGTQLVYSNSGFVLLAEALQRATGMSLPEYAQKHCFEPFQTKTAGYHGQVKAPAIGYSRTRNAWQVHKVAAKLVGPGGLFASIKDLAKFECSLLDLAHSPLGKQLLEAPDITHPVLGRYAAGWMLQSHRGLPVVRHQGGAFGSGADILRFPEQRTSIIAVVNSDALRPTSITERIADLLFGDTFPTTGDAAPTGSAHQNLGRFWRREETGAIWIVVPNRKGCRLVSLGDIKVDLISTGDSTMRSVGTGAEVTAERVGKALRLQLAGSPAFLVKQLPPPPRDTATATLHAGRYANKSLGVEVLLKHDNGRLRLRQDNGFLKIPPFIRVSANIYLCDRGAVLEFHHDAGGGVAGVTISGNRAWNIAFTRID